ncbi:MAG TPA: hypothetical protein VHD56_00990 [Tepidisphaeraceae bacterium]|nr:hypothetical protein [Tepidisphaeraceae bacterium]
MAAPSQPIPPAPPRPPSPDSDPIPILLSRAKSELSADFDFNQSISTSRAPATLDVMGGIAEYTGSTVCRMTLDRAAGVVLQGRNDRQLQVFSFNRFDDNLPFTLRMPLERLAACSVNDLRREFSEPGRTWAANIVGCLFMLQRGRLIDLNDSSLHGLNIATYSTIPTGCGLGSCSAMQVAAMMNFINHFNLRGAVEPLKLAHMCRAVENDIQGQPGGIASPITSLLGEQNVLVRVQTQSQELLPPVKLPQGFQIVCIDSGVPSNNPAAYDIARIAASMSHAIILAKMREMGSASGREMIGDPMNGYLANLDQDDYKKFFRPYLPQWIMGQEFADRFGEIAGIEPRMEYRIQQAADHHVLEARRVRQFCEFVEKAGSMPLEDVTRHIEMDKAGHLMYASHLSFMNDALLGSDPCDLLVRLVKQREKSGLYGARMTARGSGGSVAVLCGQNEHTEHALTEIAQAYEHQVGNGLQIIMSTDLEVGQ